MRPLRGSSSTLGRTRGGRDIALLDPGGCAVGHRDHVADARLLQGQWEWGWEVGWGWEWGWG